MKLIEDFRTEATEKIDLAIDERFRDRPQTTLIARCSAFCPKAANPQTQPDLRIIDIAELAIGREAERWSRRLDLEISGGILQVQQIQR